MARNNSNRGLQIENLEHRRMMAGDVAVDMIGGELIIDGDEAGNAVMVSQLNNGDFRIQGLYTDGGYTKINGESEMTVSGVNGMQIDLGEGNDRVFINKSHGGSPLTVEGDLDIRTGGGSDLVRILNTKVKGEANIVTDQDSSTGSPWYAEQPSGDDIVQVESMEVDGDFDIRTGGGSDTVDFDAYFPANWPNWNVTSDLRIDTGSGTTEGDIVDLDYIFASEQVNIFTSDGDDQVDTDRVSGKTGFYVTTLGGDDTVNISNTDMDWKGIGDSAHIGVFTGDGDDTLTMENVDVRGAVVAMTGDGSDIVTMDDVHANDEIFANLGAHPDSLSVRNSSSAFGTFLGGSNRGGGDAIDLVDSAFRSLEKTGWENVVGKTPLQPISKPGR